MHSACNHRQFLLHDRDKGQIFQRNRESLQQETTSRKHYDDAPQACHSRLLSCEIQCFMIVWHATDLVIAMTPHYHGEKGAKRATACQE